MPPTFLFPLNEFQHAGLAAQPILAAMPLHPQQDSSNESSAPVPRAQGNRRYVKCLYVFNKIDVCSMEEVDAIARQPDSIPLSCTQRLNLDTLLEMLWDMMGLVGPTTPLFRQ